MVNGFADPVVLVDAEQRHHPAERARRDAVQSQSRRQRGQAPRDLHEQLPVHRGAQHQPRSSRTRPDASTRDADAGRSDRGHRAAVRDADAARRPTTSTARAAPSRCSRTSPTCATPPSRSPRTSTACRRAEEEIRLERDRLNLIMRSVPNPIILLDIDNQPILMNHEALRLFKRVAARTATAAAAPRCASPTKRSSRRLFRSCGSIRPRA